uniref:Uncharacterized protein n=1 Tax=Panagrolaimus davidi TaxID=227884 RepID=A0A914Q5Q9_9BILA
MSNDDNSNGGRHLGDDDARALFNALDPALRHLLIQAARNHDTSQQPPDDDWDFQPVPSTSRGNIQPPSTRGNFQSSAPRGNFQLSSSRGNIQLSSSRGNFQSSASRGNFQSSASRGIFRSSSTRVPSTSRDAFEDGYYIPHSYSRGNDPMADDNQRDQRSSYGDNPARGRFYNFPSTSSAGTRGGFSSSSAARRSSTTDPSDRLLYSQAARNRYTPAESRARYLGALGPNVADGMQKIECASPLAKVKKIELLMDHFVATMNDNTIPILASASFEDFLSTARADDCLAARCSTPDFAPYSTVSWGAFLSGTRSFSALGQLHPALLRSMFQNLRDERIQAISVRPAAPMEMDFAEMCAILPDAATFLTLDAAKFTRGDTVNAIELLVNSRREKPQLVRLLLMSNRFPLSDTFGRLLQALEQITQPLSCVTLLSNIPPTDDAVTSVTTQGFTRGNIHRRGPNETYYMYIRTRGERVVAIGFKATE